MPFAERGIINMEYISVGFYFFVGILLLFYYVIPIKMRWIVLLLGSVAFYWKICDIGIFLLIYLALVSYGFGFVLHRNNTKKILLLIGVGIIVLPLVLCKYFESISMIRTVGVSFYTLQMVSYLIDIYRKKIQPEKNFLKYFLFVSFFPQIIQGPIPRYEQLKEQLYIGHRFHEKFFTKGLHLIIWGFFLKLMIADKTAIIVNIVFDNANYSGIYIWIAGILYSVQLYTDFLACVCLSQGVASLFGVQLVDNFAHPYFSRSIKEFWKRWHISLSSWLRDYVYIVLGGSRQGKIRKYINLIITFVVSGIWHGKGMKFILWGIMHAVYQIVGDITAGIKDVIYRKIRMNQDNRIRRMIQTAGTCFWVMIAWIMFRANSMRDGLRMIFSMFDFRNMNRIMDGALMHLGLSWQEWIILAGSIGILVSVSIMQERICVRDRILDFALPIRWSIYIVAILVIMVFGSYGLGFNAQEFIYGGF